jgi:PST family polysaccharide transporter
LLTFPYLIRVFGLGTFGEYTIIQTVLTYFLILVDFGFNITGIKNISQAKSIEEQSRIFNSIMASKVLLIIFSFILLLGAYFISSQVHDHFISYLFAFPAVIGQAIFPIWFYQAIQKMRVATMINASIKIFFTACIFLFIKDGKHMEFVFLFSSIGFLLGGIVSLIPVYKKYHLVMIRPNLKEVINELNESWRIFLSRVFISLYSSTNVLVLAYFRAPVIVGQYSAGDKVFRGLYNISNPMIQVFFPIQARLYNESREKYIKESKKIFTWLFFVSCLIGVAVYIFSPQIVNVVVGHVDKVVLNVLRIFVLSIIFYPFGAFFTNMLAIQNMNKVLLRAVTFSAILNFILVVPCVYYYSVEGLAYLSFVTQLFIFLYKGISIVTNLKRG